MQYHLYNQQPMQYNQQPMQYNQQPSWWVVTVSVVGWPSWWVATVSVVGWPSWWVATVSVVGWPSWWVVTVSVVGWPSWWVVTVSVDTVSRVSSWVSGGLSMSNDNFGATDCCVRLVGWFRDQVVKNWRVSSKKYLFMFLEEKNCAQ